MSAPALHTTAHGTAAHGHGEEHLAHQFEDMEQQNESYVVGMWTFLVTEIMFFGALFLAYSIYRLSYPDIFALVHTELDVTLGTINTFVLLFSSLTMALAVHAAQKGRRKVMIGWLAVVIVCSLAFLGIKAVEYYTKWEHHLVPGPNFHYQPGSHGGAGAHGAAAASHEAGEGTAEGGGAVGRNSLRGDEGVGNPAGAPQFGAVPTRAEKSDQAQLFFSIYFAMTGLHAVHIIIGMIIMLVIIGLAAFDHPSVRYFMPVEMVGLYWHFVDIVWIFLFPLLYLIGPAG